MSTALIFMETTKVISRPKKKKMKNVFSIGFESKEKGGEEENKEEEEE